MSIHLFIFRLFCCSRLPKVIFLLSFLIGIKANATHIFGGQLKLTQLDPIAGKFKVSLILYVDNVKMNSSTEQQLKSSKCIVKFYAKRDNREIQFDTLLYTSSQALVYENPACAKILQLSNSQYFFEKELILNLNDFNDSMGYYLAYDICCRNGIITNIQLPELAGMVFYTEFPALLKNGNPIQFSTPTIPLLNGDYVCANRNFTFDFGAIDPDGDQLQYSLVWPSKGRSTSVKGDETSAGPYPLVDWTAGIKMENIIPGTVPLKINPKTGMLSVNASMLGIYVFSVQVDKIRNGVKIGSVRHDFQLPVVDCSPTTPPVPIITLNASPIKEVAICPGDKVILATEANPRWAFQWQKDGDNISNAKSNQLEVKAIGNYNVIKSFNDQCVNDTTSAIVAIKYKKDIEASILKPDRTCIGDSMLLKVTSTASRNFEWYFSGALIAKTNTLYAKNKGLYLLKESPQTALCNLVLDSILVKFEALPVAAAVSAPVAICLRDTAYLQTSGPSTWTYQWFKNKGLLANQTAALLAVRDTGNYYVQVSDALGCKNLSKAYRVNLKDDCREAVTKLQVPDIFSPNADGINDTWLIRNLDLNPESIVTVFNRWGEVVYYSDNYSASPWDGRYNGQIVPTGVYAYTIQLPKAKYTMRGQLMVAY